MLQYSLAETEEAFTQKRASGLSPGDTIVTRGSYILKNEILKDAVGAGCCEVDHLKK